MKHMRITIIATVAAAGAAALFIYRRADARSAETYRYAQATRGDLQSTVSATGTLGAVTTVQVGTQVSGQIAAINVDFNDHVKKGQLLARIDPTLAQQAVEDAQASLERVQAQLAQADGDFARDQTLYDQKMLTTADFDASKAADAVAKANVKSAQIALERAKQNLGYTSIYAPIDGVIVERDVDVGQTVAASLSAPQLFLIANDLSQMQILASVDESDIGLVHNGQTVDFSVQTYPNASFTGTVRQVRLQSTTTNNVVNYTVVVSVANRDGRLLPGMTATVHFVTGSVRDALLVPNTALRVQATDAMRAEVGASGATTADQGASSRGLQIWYRDSGGRLAVTGARVVLTDGKLTAVEATGLSAGDQVVVGVTQASTGTSATTTTTVNPLQPQQGGRGGPPGPPPGGV